MRAKSLGAPLSAPLSGQLNSTDVIARLAGGVSSTARGAKTYIDRVTEFLRTSPPAPAALMSIKILTSFLSSTVTGANDLYATPTQKVLTMDPSTGDGLDQKQAVLLVDYWVGACVDYRTVVHDAQRG